MSLGPRSLRKTQHWKDLLQADAEKPYFFEFAMMVEDAAHDIASSKTAMKGVFTYDQK